MSKTKPDFPIKSALLIFLFLVNGSSAVQVAQATSIRLILDASLLLNFIPNPISKSHQQHRVITKSGNLGEYRINGFFMIQQYTCNIMLTMFPNFSAMLYIRIQPLFITFIAPSLIQAMSCPFATSAITSQLVCFAPHPTPPSLFSIQQL